MPQRILYSNSAEATKKTKVGHLMKGIAVWMDSLPGTVYEGKTIKSIQHFELQKAGVAWDVIVLVETD
ncbi:hypothetical protein IQ250_23750 [Pseudanabaenaceae cyanobacterium LEGE 13415]|nr:hypothetical protein [Pseudanabaenaceae cyanobacterium LEGE 13415]